MSRMMPSATAFKMSSVTETSVYQASNYQPGHGVNQEERTHEDQESGRKQPIEQKEATKDLTARSHRPQAVVGHLLEVSRGVGMAGSLFQVLAA